MQGRQAYSIGAAGEYHLGKSRHWYLDFQHDLGITNQGLLFVHTTLPFAVYASAATYGSGHYHHGNGYAGALAMLMPSGVSYYYMDTRQTRRAFYANPLNYTYWQTERGTEISMINPEAGFKVLKHLNSRSWLMVSAGVGYSFSIGGENLLPMAYSNSLFTSVKIALVWGESFTFYKRGSRNS